MRRHKAVTKNKLEANRKNSKHSTGPRSQRGKNVAKFNAVTLGLFAKHILIEICDGDKAQAAFQSLLNDLHQQFEPLGTLEEWLVAQIAECMWKLRRATQCENGLIEESVFRPIPSPFCRDEAEFIFQSWQDDDRFASRRAQEVGLLTNAEREIRESGTLSPHTYRELQPLLEKQLTTENTDTSAVADLLNIDKNLLLSQIADCREFLEPHAAAAARIAARSFAKHAVKCSLPELGDMEKIFRYEKRMRKKFDWALQILLRTQERRKSREGNGGGVSVEVTKSVKRTQ
jgi:hypothetical protein